MSKDLVSTPTDYGTKTSTAPSGAVKTNGEPGLPERTTSSQSVAEVTYDHCAGLKPGQQK